MKLATPALLAALCLTACLAGPEARAAPGDPAPARATPERILSEKAASEPSAAQAAPRATSPGARAERRRRSYAACNRASHQRGLYGGRRRRFLIRCRLGYERTRVPQSQAPAAAPQGGPAQAPPQGASPAQPGRKP